MKKLLFLVLFAFSFGIAAKAQDDKDKIKKTSTPVQKVHNTFSRHKKHKGYKVKHEQRMDHLRFLLKPSSMGGI